MSLGVQTGFDWAFIPRLIKVISLTLIATSVSVGETHAQQSLLSDSSLMSAGRELSQWMGAGANEPLGKFFNYKDTKFPAHYFDNTMSLSRADLRSCDGLSGSPQYQVKACGGNAWNLSKAIDPAMRELGAKYYAKACAMSAEEACVGASQIFAELGKGDWSKAILAYGVGCNTDFAVGRCAEELSDIFVKEGPSATATAAYRWGCEKFGDLNSCQIFYDKPGVFGAFQENEAAYRKAERIQTQRHALYEQVKNDQRAAGEAYLAAQRERSANKSASTFELILGGIQQGLDQISEQNRQIAETNMLRRNGGTATLPTTPAAPAPNAPSSTALPNTRYSTDRVGIAVPSAGRERIPECRGGATPFSEDPESQRRAIENCGRISGSPCYTISTKGRTVDPGC